MSQTDTQPDDEEQNEHECPLCGQPYDHKRREMRSSMGQAEYRSDARVCKTSPLGGERTAYIHLP